MDASPVNVSFTLAVNEKGERWGVAVIPSPDGSYDAKLYRVAQKREPGDTLTCIDPRRVQECGSAHFVDFIDLARLPGVIDRWRQGRLGSTPPLEEHPIEGSIPAFLLEVIDPVKPEFRWVLLDDDGLSVVPKEEFKFCGPLA